jgi:hypothetical protein
MGRSGEKSRESSQTLQVTQETYDFGLSTDGMNPFGEQSCSHSTWPVTLCNYNLPPWLCMKRKFIMMPVLIQGPKQPGNDIDVYLRPLVDELLQLWAKPGVRLWD